MAWPRHGPAGGAPRRACLTCLSGQRWGPCSCSAAYGGTCFSVCLFVFTCHYCYCNMSKKLVTFLMGSICRAPRLSSALKKASRFILKPCQVLLHLLLRAAASVLTPPSSSAPASKAPQPSPKPAHSTLFPNGPAMLSETLLWLSSTHHRLSHFRRAPRIGKGTLEVRMSGQRGCRGHFLLPFALTRVALLSSDSCKKLLGNI